MDAGHLLSVLTAAFSPVTFSLLFFPEVMKHFSTDQSRILGSILSGIPFRMVDKVATLIIATALLLLSLGLLLVTLRFFSPLVLYPLLGLAAGGFLFTFERRARVACICWQAILVVYFLLWPARDERFDGLRNPLYRGEAYTAAYCALAIIYLRSSLMFINGQDKVTARPLELRPGSGHQLPANNKP